MTTTALHSACSEVWTEGLALLLEAPGIQPNTFNSSFANVVMESNHHHETLRLLDTYPNVKLWTRPSDGWKWTSYSCPIYRNCNPEMMPLKWILATAPPIKWLSQYHSLRGYLRSGGQSSSPQNALIKAYFDNPALHRRQLRAELGLRGHPADFLALIVLLCDGYLEFIRRSSAGRGS